MKKIFALMLAVLMVVGLFAGCTNNKTDDKNDTKPSVTQPAEDEVKDPTEVETPDATETPDGTEGNENETTPSEDEETGDEDVELSAIAQLLKDITDVKPMQFMTMVMDVDLTDEFAITGYTGLEKADDIDVAAVCEAAMGSQAYSVVLVKVKEGVDTKAVAEAMHAGINPRKWICVEADDLIVAASGEYVILAMMDSEYAADCTAQDVINAFADKCGELSHTVKK